LASREDDCSSGPRRGRGPAPSAGIGNRLVTARFGRKKKKKTSDKSAFASAVPEKKTGGLRPKAKKTPLRKESKKAGTLTPKKIGEKKRKKKKKRGNLNLLNLPKTGRLRQEKADSAGRGNQKNRFQKPGCGLDQEKGRIPSAGRKKKKRMQCSSRLLTIKKEPPAERKGEGKGPSSRIAREKKGEIPCAGEGGLEDPDNPTSYVLAYKLGAKRTGFAPIGERGGGCLRAKGRGEGEKKKNSYRADPAGGGEKKNQGKKESLELPKGKS